MYDYLIRELFIYKAVVLVVDTCSGTQVCIYVDIYIKGIPKQDKALMYGTVRCCVWYGSGNDEDGWKQESRIDANAGGDANQIKTQMQIWTGRERKETRGGDLGKRRQSK